MIYWSPFHARVINQQKVMGKYIGCMSCAVNRVKERLKNQTAITLQNVMPLKYCIYDGKKERICNFEIWGGKRPPNNDALALNQNNETNQ